MRDFVDDLQDTLDGSLEILTGVITGDSDLIEQGKDKIYTAWTTNRYDDTDEPSPPVTATVKTPTATAQLTDIPTIAGAKNSSANGTVYPYVMGKHRYSPRFISSYRLLSGVDGETQTYHGMYLLGVGDVDAKDFKLGQIDLNSNSGNTVNSVITGGYNTAFFPDAKLEIAQSGHELSLYPYMIYEEQRNTELTNIDGTNGLTAYAFSAPYPKEVELEFTFKGLGYYDSDSNFKQLSVDLQVQYSTDGGQTFKSFAPIGATQAQRTITVENQGNGIQRVTGKKSKTMRFVAHLTLTKDEALAVTNNVIEFKVKRVSAETQTSGTVKQVFDTVYLSGVRTWCYDPSGDNSVSLSSRKPILDSHRDKTTRLAFEVVASDAIEGTIDELNCIVQGKYRTVEKNTDGTYGEWTTTKSFTDNPASIALDILTNEDLRGDYAYTDSELDMESFRDFYIWCDKETSTKPKYHCNGIITGQIRTDELISKITSIGRAYKTLNGRKWGICIDNERTTPVMVINNQSIMSASNTKSFVELPDAYRVSFINELIGYKTDERDVYFDYATEAEWKQANPNKEPRVSKVSVAYITNPDDVYRYIKGVMARKVCRNEVWHRTLGIDGNLLEMGCLATLQDDTIMVGIGDGAEITSIDYEYGYITGFTTDGKFPVDDTSKRYGVKIEQADGVHAPKVQTYEVKADTTGIYTHFELSSPISVNAEMLPSVGDILSFGIYDRISTDVLVFGKKDNGNGTFDITLVPYNDDVYDEPSTVPAHVTYITQPTDFGNVPITQRYATIEELENGLSEVSQKQSDYWSAIARDGVVSPSEKVTLDKEWKIVVGEKAVIDERIEQIGATERDEYTDYVSAYNSLNTYLNTTLDIFDDMDSETEVDTATFVDYYNAFYIAYDILKAYITYFDISEQMTDRVPIMKISAPYIVASSNYTQFTPSTVKLTGVLYNGEVESDYNSIFEVYVNGSTTPFYRSSSAELNATITIPADTHTILFVMRDKTGSVIFDKESRNIITSSDRLTLNVTNAYQLLSNSLDSTSVYVPSVFSGARYGVSYDAEVTKATADNVDTRIDGDTIYFTNKSSFNNEDTIEVQACIDGDYQDVFGIVVGDEVIILGEPTTEMVIGNTDAEFATATIDVLDLDTETFRRNLLTADNQYLGVVTNADLTTYDDTTTIARAKTGDYFLYGGTSTTKYEKGIVYQYDGVTWNVDNNINHQSTALVDSVETSGVGVTETSLGERLVSALIEKLFAREITLLTGGKMHSQGYNPNYDNGFEIDSYGHVTFNDADIRGSIKANDLYITGLESGTNSIYRHDDRISIKTAGYYAYKIIPSFDDCIVKVDFSANGLTPANVDYKTGTMYVKIYKNYNVYGKQEMLYDDTYTATRPSMTYTNKNVSINKGDTLYVSCYIMYGDDTKYYLPEQFWFNISVKYNSPFAMAMISEIPVQDL